MTKLECTKYANSLLAFEILALMERTFQKMLRKIRKYHTQEQFIKYRTLNLYLIDMVQMYKMISMYSRIVLFMPDEELNYNQEFDNHIVRKIK